MKISIITLLTTLLFASMLIGQVTMEIEGKLKVGNDASSATEGMIRWNSATADFEGYNGTSWVSLTQSQSEGFSFTDFGTTKACESKIIFDDQDGDTGDSFGHSIDLNGDCIVIGAPFQDENAFNEGAAYVHNSSGSFKQKLLPTTGTINEQFGTDVAISDDWIVVGAIQDDINSTDSGSAYFFEKVGNNWKYIAAIGASDGANDDWFGFAVDATSIKDRDLGDKEMALVGAYGNDDQGSATGSAYLFEYNGSSWIEVQKFTASDAASNDLFGYAVAMDGLRFVVGAYGDDDIGSSSGSVYVYSYSKFQNNWLETKITAVDGRPNDNFGRSVAIDGNFMIVGAPFEDNDGGTNNGAAYVYEYISGTWQLVKKLVVCDGTIAKNFGKSVAVSGNHFIIGVENDNPNGTNSGSAYLFEKVGTDIPLKAKLMPSDGQTNFRFGKSVSIHEEDALIGSPQHNKNGSGSGAVYKY